MIAVAQDSAGLRIAAAELLEQSLVEQARCAVASRNQALADGIAPRGPSLPAAYTERVAFLLKLERALDAGVHPQLLAEDVRGMLALETARREFKEKHPGCPRCSAPVLDRASWDLCWSCWQPYEEKK